MSIQFGRSIEPIRTDVKKCAYWGTFVTTPEVSAANAAVTLKVTVDNNTKADANVRVASQILALDASGQRAASAVVSIPAVNAPVAGGKSASVDTSAIARELAAIVHAEDPTRPVTAACNGAEAARNGFSTLLDAMGFNYKPDNYISFHTIARDGHDLSFVTLTVTDKNGLMVPRSKNSITFEISGPGEIVATDNGDATDLAAFTSKERKAFNGLVLAIVKAKSGQAGIIIVKAKSEGVITASTKIQMK